MAQGAPPTYAGIIFDFNGVLLWDRHLHDSAWRDFAVSWRGRPFSDRELAQSVHGRTNADIMGYLFGRPVSGAELARLVEEKEAAYRRLCLAAGAAFQLSPGAVPLLNFLKEEQLPFTIATSSGAGNLEFFWFHLGLGQWFSREKIVYDDGLLAGKPAPDMYRRAAAYLELPPEACVVVEDSLSGINAAAAAGIGHVVALVPVEEQAALQQKAGVDLLITSLAALPRALFNNGR